MKAKQDASRWLQEVCSGLLAFARLGLGRSCMVQVQRPGWPPHPRAICSCISGLHNPTRRMEIGNHGGKAESEHLPRCGRSVPYLTLYDGGSFSLPPGGVAVESSCWAEIGLWAAMQPIRRHSAPANHRLKRLQAFFITPSSQRSRPKRVTIRML